MIRKILILIFMCFSLAASARPSLESLIGKLDVGYHIRSDILTYINESVPTFSNSWKALIKIAQNQNFLYYYARTHQEAESAVIDTSIAQKCLNMEYDDNEGYHLFKGIESRMGDTMDRRNHIFEVSNYFFGRRGFTHLKIKSEELAQRCDSGNYG